MSKYFVRTYYTIDEIFEDFDFASIQALIQTFVHSSPTLNSKFEDVLNILYDEYQEDWYIGYIDRDIINGEEQTGTDAEEAAKKLKLQISFLRKLSSIYNFTNKRYIYLLNLYESQESHLLDQLVTTVSVTADHRVNDTPQNGGAWEDDDHTSVYEENGSTTTTEGDPTTVMARIDEIQNLYMNVLKDWCKEFDQLFIPPHGEFDAEE